jgi:MFS family permease
LGEACYFPASMALLSAYHGPETRSRAISWHQSSIYVGTILGGSVAGFLAEHYGWQSSFYLFGSAGILLGFVLVWLLKDPPPTAAPDAAPPDFKLRTIAHDLFGKPMPVILMIVFIGANFVTVVFLTWLPYYLNQHFHMSLGRSGWNATAYLQAASVTGVLIGGVVGDALARKYRGGRMLVQASGLLISTPFLALSGWSGTVPLLLFSVTGLGLFRGFYDANLSAALHDVVPPERRATSVGVLNSLGWLGAGVGPVAMAYFSKRIGMGACLSANAIIFAASGVLLLWGVWRFMPGKVAATPETKPVGV